MVRQLIIPVVKLEEWAMMPPGTGMNKTYYCEQEGMIWSWERGGRGREGREREEKEGNGKGRRRVGYDATWHWYESNLLL